MNKIKVAIVDDSALIRHLLSEIVNRTEDMEVVGTAADPHIARELIRNTNPDVVTLDIEMPHMDGLAFLEKIMRLRPMPVIMISTLTEAGSEAAIRAFELGAFDVIAKPKADVVRGIEAYADDLVDKIRAAAKVKPKKLIAPIPAKQLSEDSAQQKRARPRLASSDTIIAIGSSTGGTEALRTVMEGMPADSPAILMTQHMPEAFTKSFARRLDGISRLSVKEAEHGDVVIPGHGYLAPGHSHMLIVRKNGQYVIQLSDAEPVNRHRPSVDVLFDSVAKCAGKHALGVILTGMGKDGARGMLEMHKAGAWTVAQDEASCVVFGMPREAIQLGGVTEVEPLTKIAGVLISHLKQIGYGGKAIA
ncbi:chemotaxis response regulator protein-glutamate methylesterase [Burkholderiaceae bacterium DAT-1]|nr:chemotaxis response regulator protein-glutamate methylesterase [Burkholderiaceae bacterium DAT-1]